MAKKPKQSSSNGSVGEPGYFFGLVGRSVQQVWSNPKPALLYILLYVLASIASQAVQQGVHVYDENYRSYESIINLIFIGTLPLYGLYVADKKSLSIGDFTYIQPRMFFAAFATSILVGLLAVISIFLLFIPLIWVLGWFALSLYPVVENGLTPIQGMKASRELCLNRKRYIWGATATLILFSVPFILLVYVPYVGSVGVGLLTVLSAVFYANIYRDFQKAEA